MIRRPPRSTPFPTRRSSDLAPVEMTSAAGRRRNGKLSDGEELPREQHHPPLPSPVNRDRKSTRLNSSHVRISYAVFCLKKKKIVNIRAARVQHHKSSAVRLLHAAHTLILYY